MTVPVFWSGLLLYGGFPRETRPLLWSSNVSDCDRPSPSPNKNPKTTATARRRVWQPPQAKAVDVGTVTRNTLSGMGSDGSSGGGCDS